MKKQGQQVADKRNLSPSLHQVIPARRAPSGYLGIGRREGRDARTKKARSE